MSETGQPPRRRVGGIMALAAVGMVLAVALVVSMLMGSFPSGTSQASATASVSTPPPATAATSAPTTTQPTTAPTTAPATTVSPSVTASPTVTPVTPVPQKVVVVDVHQLTAGSAHRVAYYEGRVPVCDSDPGPAPPPATPAPGYIYPAKGSPIPIHLGALESVQSFTRLGSGYLVWVDNCFISTAIRRYAADGTLVRQSQGQPNDGVGFVAGADGSVAVDFTPGHFTLFSPAGKKLQSWTLPGKVKYVTPYAVLADHSVMVVGQSWGRRWHLMPDGSIATDAIRAPYGLFTSPANGDLVTQIKCGTGVLDMQTLQPRWIDCGYSPGAFNADGTVIAAAADGGRGIVGLLDASTGDVLVRFQAKYSPWDHFAIVNMSWEDNSHLLVVEQKGLTRYVMFRFGLDGSVEQVPIVKPPLSLSATLRTGPTVRLQD